MLLGASWEVKVYVDKQLPFGLSSALVIFNAYADGVEWVYIGVNVPASHGID